MKRCFIFCTLLVWGFCSAWANDEDHFGGASLEKSFLPTYALGAEFLDPRAHDALPAVPPRPLVPEWYAFKDRLDEEYGFKFALAYSALYQRASQTFEGGAARRRLLLELYDYLNLELGPEPSKDAAGGIAEFTGTWTMIRPDTPNSGSLSFEIENRHRLGPPITPQSLFLDAGAYWPTAAAFSEFNTTLLSLYYDQSFLDGRAGVRVGKFLPFVVYDFFSLKNAKADFNDAAFTLNPSIAWAAWGMGATIFLKPTERTYINAGIHDLNGGAVQGIETFFTEREYFKVVDVGYNSKFSFGDGNIHVTYWNTDKREKQNLESSKGVTIGGEQQIGRFLPYFRYGYSTGGSSPLRHFVAGGMGFKNVFGRQDDLIAFGVSWGEPTNKELFVSQTATEAFYKFHLTKELAITATVQYIQDPPLSVEDDLTVLGIRARAVF